MSTIAAISTGNTVSAIGILRLSGEETFAIADRVFRPWDGRPLSQHRRREMVYGTLLDREGRALDSCLAVTFAAGASYTGEDSAELHCHGSPVVLDEGLRALFTAGARQAGRGEFTKRAFLSGNLDLTQAEAVIDLIEAETAAAARNAVEQLGGSLRRRIGEIYDALLDIASRFYAVVDYPDEDIEDLSLGDIARTLEAAEGTLRALLATAARGRVLKSGVATAIVGAPNAGKSSLLNALVGYDRAIVTDIPGTTRDTVEERAVVGGVLLRLIDTAGIRDTEDAVEQLGVERSRRALEEAELILALIDGSAAPEGENIENFFAPLRLAATSGKPWLLVQTKADLGGGFGVLIDDEGWSQPAAVLSLSSVTHEGFDQLEQAVAALFPAGEAPAGQILTNARQTEAVERAAAAIAGAREAMALALTPDAVLTDVESAMSALGELTGRTVREDIVGRIFERFCVGK